MSFGTIWYQNNDLKLQLYTNPISTLLKYIEFLLSVCIFCHSWGWGMCKTPGCCPLSVLPVFLDRYYEMLPIWKWSSAKKMTTLTVLKSRENQTYGWSSDVWSMLAKQKCYQSVYKKFWSWYLIHVCTTHQYICFVYRSKKWNRLLKGLGASKVRMQLAGLEPGSSGLEAKLTV